MAGSFEHNEMSRCIFIIVISKCTFILKHWNTVVYPEELGEFRTGIDTHYLYTVTGNC
jgi:hypothetical protein